MGKKRDRRPEQFLDGPASAEDLVRAIQAANPTGRGLDASATSRRYALKSAFQSRLLREHPDAVDIREEPGQDGLVVLTHRTTGRTAGHAVVAELDDDARAHVLNAIAMASLTPDRRGRASSLSARTDDAAPPIARAPASDTDDPVQRGREALESWDYDAARTSFELAHRQGRADGTLALLELLVDHVCDDTGAVGVRLPAAADPSARILQALAAARLGLDDVPDRVRGIHVGRVVEVWAELGRRAVRTGPRANIQVALRALELLEERDAGLEAELRDALEALQRDSEAEDARRWAALLAEGDLDRAERETREVLARAPAHRAARRVAEEVVERRRQATRASFERRAHEVEQANPEECLRLLTAALELGATHLDARIRQLRLRNQGERRARAIDAAVQGLCESGPALPALLAFGELTVDERSDVRERLPWPELQWWESLRGRGERRAAAVLALRDALDALASGDLPRAARQLDDAEPLAGVEEHRAARTVLRAAHAERAARSARDALTAAHAALDADPEASLQHLEGLPTDLLPTATVEAIASARSEARARAEEQRKARRYLDLRATGHPLDAARHAARSGTDVAWRWRRIQAEHCGADALPLVAAEGRGRPPVEPGFTHVLRQRDPFPRALVTGDGDRLVLPGRHGEHVMLSVLRLPDLEEEALAVLPTDLLRDPPSVHGDRVWVGMPGGDTVEIDLERWAPMRRLIQPQAQEARYAKPSVAVHGSRAWLTRNGPAECWDLDADRLLAYRTDVRRVLVRNGRFLAWTTEDTVVELHERYTPTTLGGVNDLLSFTLADTGLVILAGNVKSDPMRVMLARYDGSEASPEITPVRFSAREIQLASDGPRTWLLGRRLEQTRLATYDLTGGAPQERWAVPVPDDAVLVTGSSDRVGLLTRTTDGLAFAWLGDEPPDVPQRSSPVRYPRRDDIGLCAVALVDARPDLAQLCDEVDGLGDALFGEVLSRLDQEPVCSPWLRVGLFNEGQCSEALRQAAEARAGADPLVALMLADLDAERLDWTRVLQRLEAMPPTDEEDVRRHAHHLRAVSLAWLGRTEEARAELDAMETCEGECPVTRDVVDPDAEVAALQAVLAGASTWEELAAPEVWDAVEVQTLLRRAALALDGWDSSEPKRQWVDVLLATSAASEIDGHLHGSAPSPDALEGEAVEAVLTRAGVWLAAQLRPAERRAELVLDEIDQQLRVRFRCTYDGVQPAADASHVSAGRRRVPRDLEWERTVASRFAELQGAPDQRLLTGDDALDFLSDALPILAREWTVLGHDRLLRFRLAPPLEPRVGPDGLTLELTSGDRSLPGADALAAWLAGMRYVRLDDGAMARLPEAWMRRHAEDALDVLRAGPAAHTVFVRRRLQGLDHAPPDRAPPPGLRARLRPYQREGFAWLAHRRDLGVGCVLADDMGLGKTVQTLALLLDTHRTHDGRPSLVVVPTSVLGNWQEEIERFTPELHRKLVVYHGAERTLPEGEAVVLTTPGIVRLDADALAAVRWRTLVVDEAQALRNPRSHLVRALCGLDAEHRVALSGTPLENRTDELWSLFQVIEPGLLGTRSEFLARWSTALPALRERVAPFVLRRRKSEVATELPARQTMVLRCALSDAEREVYDRVRAGAAQALEAIPEGTSVGPVVLAGLLRLRQACCHSALLVGFPGALPGTSSKVELLLERLQGAIEAGHRCLVFSQWTRLLDLVEPQLQARGWRWLRLDGSCSVDDRSASVAAWARPDGPPIFLLSLKAGGVGLNLTAADHVVFLDPWWNPAVEAQAHDRAHRIGQTRPVMVYKLVAADTIEERVLRMQHRKLALFSAVIDGAADAPEMPDIVDVLRDVLT